MMMLQKNKILPICFLVLIVTIGALLRFIDLKEQGLLFWDEGMYLIKARSFINTAKECVFNFSELAQNKNAFFENLHKSSIEGGIPLGREKPLYSFLIALFSVFMGLKDYTSLFVSSFFGVATLILIFFFSKSMYSIKEGILASLMLALSCFHVVYSRLGLAETSSCFFVLLSVFIYYLSRTNHRQAREKYLFFSGIALSIAIGMHYRCFIVAFFLLLLEMHFFLSSRRSFSLIKRIKFLIVIVASLMIVPILLEVMIRFTMYHASDLAVYKEGYFSHIIKASSLGLERTRMGEPFLYFIYLFRTEGIIFLSLLILGIVHMVCRRKFEDLMTLYFILMPLVLFMFMAYKPPRALLVYFPFFCITSSRGLFLLRNKKILLSLVIVALIASQFVKVNKYLTMTSGYSKAAKFIVESGYNKVIAGNTPLAVFYFGEKNVFKIPNNKEDLLKLYKNEKVKVVIVDFFSDYFRHSLTLRKYISFKIEPVFVAETFSANSLFLYENSPYTKTVRKIMRNELHDKVEVYALEDLFR